MGALGFLRLIAVFLFIGSCRVLKPATLRRENVFSARTIAARQGVLGDLKKIHINHKGLHCLSDARSPNSKGYTTDFNMKALHSSLLMTYNITALVSVKL
jgi:hypothetical protein